MVHVVEVVDGVVEAIEVVEHCNSDRWNKRKLTRTRLSVDVTS